MIDLRITLSRQPITYDEFSGLVESMRGWDFVSDVSVLPHSSQLQSAQPQETEERAENSPASPVQQAKDAIKPADYEYCPHCHGSFSFAKLGSNFKCKWCKKDVRTSGRLA